MKISELIQELKEAEDEYGDIDVKIERGLVDVDVDVVVPYRDGYQNPKYITICS